jgi:hypothetical protein
MNKGSDDVSVDGDDAHMEKRIKSSRIQKGPRKIVTHHLKYEIEIYFRINDMLRAYSRKLTKRIARISPSSLEIAPEILSKRRSPPEYDFHRSKIEFVLRASYGNNTAAAFKKKKKKPTNKRASAMIKAVVPTRNDDSDDDWKEVLDDASGQTYFWNTRTNETTALGDPKPLQRQQRNALQHHHHHHREDDIFSSSSPPNVMFVNMGTIFLFGIGGSIGVTFIAALLGFR